MSPDRSADHVRALGMLVLANFYWGLSFPVIKAVVLLHEKLLPAAGSWFSTLYTVAPRFLLAVLLMFALRPRDCLRAAAKERVEGHNLWVLREAREQCRNCPLRLC